FAGNAADALDFFRSPLLHFLAEIIEAVDTLSDELLVLPPVLEDVPHHAVEHRDIGSRPHAHIFSRMGGGARQARIADDEIRLLKLPAFEQMLERYGMGLGRIADHDDLGFGIADIVEAVRHRAVPPGVGYAGDRR